MRTITKKTEVAERFSISMSAEEYRDLCDSYGGVCFACGEIAFDGCEPDAERYPCDNCDSNRVYGIEQAMLYGHVVITEEDRGVL